MFGNPILNRKLDTWLVNTKESNDGGAHRRIDYVSTCNGIPYRPHPHSP